MTARVLVVDDIPANVKLLDARLTAEYFDVVGAYSGREALAICARERIDVVLLDVMMPGMDGLTLCREIRKDPRLSTVPVLLLTARDSEMDQIIGLEVGADDFVSKSASPLLIATRLKSLLRRAQQEDTNGDILAFGALLLDRQRREVRNPAGPVPLTSLEYDLLLLLVENPQRVFTREDLLRAIWNEVVVNDRTIDVHIKNLRQKIGADGALIETVRGVGYRVRRPA